jgi:hypothetical protein
MIVPLDYPVINKVSYKLFFRNILIPLSFQNQALNKFLRLFIGSIVFLGFCLGAMSFWFYDIGELSCKWVAKSHLEEKTGLKTVTISAKEFASSPNKDEVKVGGSLYDVAGYEINGDSVTITVWHDTEEETLQNKVVTLFENQQQINNAATGAHLVKYHPYFPDVKIIPYHSFIEHPFILTGPDNRYAIPKSYQLFIISLADIIKPPPDNFVVCC